MDVAALFLILANLFQYITMSEVENIYSDSGWRPIPNERVFSDYWNSRVSSVRWEHPNNSARQSYIKVVDAPKINNELIESNVIEPVPTKSQDPIIEVPINREEEKEEEFNKNDNMDSGFYPFRKGKKIDLESNSNLDKTDIIIHNDIISNEEKQTSKQFNKSSIYEVIEDKDEDLLSADQNIYLSKSNNYEAHEENKANNLTSNLLNILSNYNIRTSDKLTNYDLSLRQNTRNTNTGYFYMKVPIHLKYNSANHVPVDPLLAVFLSNYGHYLPGLFGFQQNYRNLYGYSASNNIHNNKPFGAYKVFSDTDSSAR